MADYLYLWETTAVRQTIETARTSVSSGGHSSSYWCQQRQLAAFLIGGGIRRSRPTSSSIARPQAPFWGNSPETVATQVLAEQLQIDPQDIVVTYSDSDHGLNGTGPGGSRFTVMLAGAVVGAAQQLKEKLIRIAAHMMEADASDLELRDGKVGVRGVPGMEKTLAEVALHAHFFRLSWPDDPSLTSGLDAAHVYDHPVTTLPAADRKDMGIFYPIMGHMCHLPGTIFICGKPQRYDKPLKQLGLLSRQADIRRVTGASSVKFPGTPNPEHLSRIERVPTVGFPRPECELAHTMDGSLGRKLLCGR